MPRSRWFCEVQRRIWTSPGRVPVVWRGDGGCRGRWAAMSYLLSDDKQYFNPVLPATNNCIIISCSSTVSNNWGCCYWHFSNYLERCSRRSYFHPSTQRNREWQRLYHWCYKPFLCLLSDGQDDCYNFFFHQLFWLLLYPATDYSYFSALNTLAFTIKKLEEFIFLILLSDINNNCQATIKFVSFFVKLKTIDV